MPFESETFGAHASGSASLGDQEVHEHTNEIRIKKFHNWEQWYHRGTRQVKTTYKGRTVDASLDLVPIFDPGENTALLLAIKCDEPEIAVRLVRRNTSEKCVLKDADGKTYPRLDEYIPEHQQVRSGGRGGCEVTGAGGESSQAAHNTYRTHHAS